MEAKELDQVTMRLAMTGVFHGLTHQSRKVFEHYIRYGDAESQVCAQVGMALLAMANGQVEAAKQIVDTVKENAPENMGIKALIYKLAKDGHSEEILSRLESMGGEPSEFAKDIREHA